MILYNNIDIKLKRVKNIMYIIYIYICDDNM